MSSQLKQLRTFLLCLLALSGVLGLSWHGGWRAIETSVAISVPLSRQSAAPSLAYSARGASKRVPDRRPCIASVSGNVPSI